MANLIEVELLGPSWCFASQIHGFPFFLSYYNPVDNRRTETLLNIINDVSSRKVIFV